MVVIGHSYIVASFFMIMSSLVQGLPDIRLCSEAFLANTSDMSGASNLSVTQPFDPFTLGSYTFVGRFTPSERFPSRGQTAHDLINEAQSFLTNVYDPSIRVQRGLILTYHSGPGGELEISFTFHFSGNAPFTYASVNIALALLKRGLQQRPNIDAHPLYIEITQLRQPQIEVSISKRTNSKQFQLRIETPLTMEIFSWPSRALEAGDAQDVLNNAESAIKAAGSPTTVVSRGFKLSKIVRSVMTALGFNPSQRRLVKYRDVYDLLHEIGHQLERGQSYCEVYGTLYWDDSGQPTVQLGSFKLAPAPNDLVQGSINNSWAEFNATVA